MISLRNRTNILGISFALFALIAMVRIEALSSLARNDAYPVFSSLDPQDFLLTHVKLQIKDPEFAKLKNDNAGISISPFGQNAERGRDLDGVRTPLGDLKGRWGMIPLLFGKIPPGQTLAPVLETALNNLFPGVAPGDLNDPNVIDPNQEFGYFSVPLKYRKRGVRFDLFAYIGGGFGVNFQTGVVCLSQTSTGFIDKTCDVTFGCPFQPSVSKEDVEKYLMKPLKTIAEQIKLSLCDFSEVSIEEIRFNLFWRNAFEVNKNLDDWPLFLFIPFLELSASISPGETKDPDNQLFNKAFAVPFGNNDHTAVGFTAGMNFDFIESIEIGAEVGSTYFFKQDFDSYRVPTSACQTGIFPFRTSVRIRPGINWHFGAKLSAYHFLDRLSGWFQYVQMEHKPDSITLRKCEDLGFFLPEVLECRSSFKVKVANMALNYDISPNIALGIFVQLPLGQQNAYRSTTVMFSFNGNF